MSLRLYHPHIILVSDNIERKTCRQHGPGGEKENVPACKGREILLVRCNRGNSVQDQYRAVGPLLFVSDQKADDNQHLYSGNHGKGGAAHPWDMIKVLINASGMFWADEFIQSPDEHHDKYAYPQQKKRQW